MLDLLKIFLPTAIAFFAGIAMTPALTDYLYKNKMWKKKAGKIDPAGKHTPIFNELHKDKEVGIPRMGGVIIWMSTLLTVSILFLISVLFSNPVTTKLSFLSQNQTVLPLFTFIVASLLGLIDDLLQIKTSGTPEAGGLSFFKRAGVVALLGLIGGAWFYFKLDPDVYRYLHIPFVAEPFYIGILVIPLFITVMLALFSSGVIDGIDGLSGGIMAIIFSAYTGIAFFQGQFDIAALCATIAGATLAFLWFNIPPARFYMSETGIIGLTTVLTFVVFLTNSVITLPIIALPLVATSASVIIQLTSKKLRGKKVFLVAPLHHHFEAIGWPAYKVVMRYWVIGIICALVGMIITIVGQ
jgi:phospho-N-acetylmuramoyl-pentapeptide-transferase